MTSSELQNSETVCDEIIRSRVAVHAKEVPLSIAKAIQGLRAVFGEVYPDPVRVVSVGVPVEKLVSDPTGSEGSNTSVEFCGGT